jgi:hypothetical protein
LLKHNHEQDGGIVSIAITVELDEWVYKNGEITQLDYSALNTRSYSSNSRSEFLGHVNPMAGYNPHCSGVSIDHHNGAPSTLAFWAISLINDLLVPRIFGDLLVMPEPLI